MKKFNASQFTKFGFVHVADEDFTDDGTKFQIWMHEESGLKVSYARYTYTDNDEKVTEYFISPREEYYSHGLMYDDVKDEPEYKASDKFNGCFEVDVEELVELLKARHEMFLRVKAAVDAEEIDMDPVIARALVELNKLNDLVELVRANVNWWELSEYQMKNAARNMKWVERDIHRLANIIGGGSDRAEQRSLANSFEKYGYVVNKLEDGGDYSSYVELCKIAC